MNVLIACECSQTVCKEFRALGHEAYSCDIEEQYGGHPEWHIKGDCLEILRGGQMFKTEDGTAYNIDKWDLIIAHPPCTYLSNAATRSHSMKGATLEQISARTAKRIQAQEFFMKFANVNCEKVAIENPVGVMSTVYRKPDQIVEPYQFAESVNDKENYVTKKTCLWLKGLKPLQGNGLSKPDNAKLFGRHPSGKAKCWNEMQWQKNRAIVRSKTFPGIARAMAEQWGGYMINIKSLKAGQTLYLVRKGYESNTHKRELDEIKKVEVIKVGRKYVIVNVGGYFVTFDSQKNFKIYNCYGMVKFGLYLSEKDYFDELIKVDLLKKIKDFFSNINKQCNLLSLEELENINSIIEKY